MGLPKYKAIDEPLLCLIYLKGGTQYQIRSDDTYQPLADHFNLTPEERNIGRRFPDNRFEYKWHNLVQYARMRLSKAGCLDNKTPRGLWRLTNEGKSIAEKLVNKYPSLPGLSDYLSTQQQAGLPDVDLSVTEGGKKLVTHLRRERNRKIVQTKKREVLNQTGKMRCEVCGFDFYEVYGSLGKNFCEVHHKIPISASEIETETRLEDLAIICSNCHRIIHRTKPMLDI
jgi:Mrr N-terminal domain/HNH endonuclease